MDGVDRYYLRTMTLFDLVDEDSEPSPVLDEITDEDMAIIKANTNGYMDQMHKLLELGRGQDDSRVVTFERIHR